jgi:hypothetical protein
MAPNTDSMSERDNRRLLVVQGPFAIFPKNANNGGALHHVAVANSSRDIPK